MHSHLPPPAARLFAEGVRSEMATALGWPALEGWTVRDGHALLHELAHGGGPICSAAAAAATSETGDCVPFSASSAVAPHTAGAPAASAGAPAGAPPLPAAAPAAGTPLAARHRGGGGSGVELASAGAAPPALSIPRVSSSEARLGRRCPSPKQA
jgi:hypothetical protein